MPLFPNLQTFETDFNSKMVRLKELYTINYCVYIFHFNSKMVRLKVLHLLLIVGTKTDFNSKMVRLKEQLVSLKTKERQQFQFQNGTIKSNL